MANEAKYWALANKAAKQIGWLAETIFTQWAWETAHFTSANLLNNNNIAGQTWTKANPMYMRGSARPTNEGGYYIKYDDAAQGYVDFIKRNHRYDGVKNAKTVEAQIDAIAKAGWAADPHYAAGLKSLHQSNIKNGFYKMPREDKPKSTPFPGHALTKGSKGKNVELIQKKVGAKVDGVFGPKTEIFVKEYQKKHGLSVDGIVGKNTWNKIF